MHTYLTAPFVLSWSFREAMSCGAPIVASDVAPVREFMSSGTEGLLVDGYDIGAIADATTKLLDNSTLATELGANARQRAVKEFDADTIAYPSVRDFLSKVAQA